MNRIFYKSVLILSLLLPTNLYAAQEIGVVTKFLIYEGMFAVNSWMASENPHAYGGIAALLFPVAAGQGDFSKTTKWVGFIGAESIAIYNLNINENAKSKSDIFKSNMVAWHIFAATVGVTGYLMGDFDTDKSITLKPLPQGGAKLAFNYKF